MEKIEFEAEMISAKDLLNALNIIPTGGLAKHIIKEEGVLINGEVSHLAGKKSYKNDTLEFDDILITII